MSPRRDEAATRAAIQEAARELFRRFGVKKTSMRELAERVGVAVGTLYLYYPSKDDLVFACVQRFQAAHREAAQALLASQAPASEKLRDYLLHRFRAAQETRQGTPFAREVTEAVLRVAPNRLEEEAQAMLATLRALLEEGARRGELGLEDLDGDAQVLLCAVGVFFPTALSPIPREPEEAQLLAVVDWFLRRWRERA
ncbi:MAG: helix-turn-helix domain-containing protein [Planctomycetota bacterium]